MEIVFSQVNPFEDLKFKKEYKVVVHDLYKINNNPNIYKEIESISKNLSSKSIELRQSNGNFAYMSITNIVKYIKDEGAIYVELNDNLLEYLIKPKTSIETDKTKIPNPTKEKPWGYTSYKLSCHLNLKSNHSKRIYELLKQYEKIKTRRIPLEEIRLILGVEDKHKLYADFKRTVLVTSQKELKKKTDIYFKFEEVKARQKVIAINFKIFPNKGFQKEQLPIDIPSHCFFNKLSCCRE